MPDRAAFWEEAMHAAEVLAGLFKPVKMNYEIHGNTIPHLHMHLYPRMAADVGRRLPALDACRRSAADIARIADAFATDRGPIKR